MSPITVGPWIYEDERLGIGEDAYEAPRVFGGEETAPKIVCTLAVRSEMEANGRLIAAAPEMLAALEEIVDLWEEIPASIWTPITESMYKAAKAAITKTETR